MSKSNAYPDAGNMELQQLRQQLKKESATTEKKEYPILDQVADKGMIIQ